MLTLTILLGISVFTLIAFIIFSFFVIVWDLFLELPYVGAGKKRILKMFKLAQIKKGETVVDLGSGDGRLLIVSAQLGARAIGYEVNPLLVLLSKLKAYLKSQTDKVEVKKENLWKANLKEADVIFVYALRKTMPKFEKFVYQNAKKGTRVIVNTNPFPAKKPQKSEDGIFLYMV